MADRPTPQEWAKLRVERPQGENVLAFVPITAAEIDTGLSLAMDQSGHLHLIIPVQSDPCGPLPSDLNGLKVRRLSLETGEVLSLSAPPSHEQVFTPFCGDIIDAIVTHGRDPYRSVAATIRAWQSAWKPVRLEMDNAVQVGLFGELLVLHSLMIPALGPAAIDQWSGPNSECHDFVSEHLHIEVKTTRKSRPEHEISRLDQLRTPAGRELLFVSVQLEQSIGGDRTLATEVDAVIELLRHDAAALDSFMASLVNLDWSEEMRNSGQLLRFFLRGAEVYAVDEDFPRLPDDFEPPSGVVSTKYTIDLANLPSLGIDEAMTAITSANPSPYPIGN